VPPAVGGLFSTVLVTTYLSYQEKLQRAILMRLFCSHVSKDVAESLWERRDQFLKDGRPLPQTVTATVLFTDLRGFTSVSEKLNAEELMEWLNEYMKAMVNIVRNNKGVVNKFIGDAIMVVFGVPIIRECEADICQDAVNAVGCAIEMGKELERLNLLWAEQQRPTVSMRVGIYTGSLVVGSLGSSQRQEYTVIGDTVNVASRLESFDKNFDTENICRILIGEPTRQCLGDQFEIEALTSVSLKGKVQKLMIYKVLGLKAR
jgi:adenylate cyclase